MEILKEVDEANKEFLAYQKEHLSKIKYIDREEDPELKKMFEEEQKKFEDLQTKLAGKIDGEIDMDMHGNVVFRTKNEKREAELP